jgi:hypothetical protein
MKSDLEALTARFDTGMEDVVEVPLLLPGWQMSALEQAAYLRGVTAAEMVRELLRTFILDKETPA